MEKFFKIKEHGSTIKTEIIAGITTFMAMAYILMVNADMFTNISVSYGAVYIATALSAVIGTLCMGLIAKLPLALASGMGINAFFVYTVCIGSGLCCGGRFEADVGNIRFCEIQHSQHGRG